MTMPPEPQDLPSHRHGYDEESLMDWYKRMFWKKEESEDDDVQG